MKRKGSLNYAFLIIVVIALAFLVLNLAGWQWPQQGEIIYENKRVVYPLYSSVCCEARSFGDWDPANFPNIQNYEQSYTCPDSTTQCRISSPQVQCPWVSWEHPLGTTPIWEMLIVNPGYISDEQYCNFPFCLSLVGYREFLPSGTVTYRGSCVDNTIYISPINIISLLGLFGGATVEPTYAHLDIQFVHTELWVHPALEGEYSIANTILCTKNQLVQDLIDENPTDKTKAQTAKVTVEQIEGIELDPSVAYEGELSQGIFPMKPGQCYLSVDKWIDIPVWGNVNPLGQYQGQDVICSMSKGLIKIDEIGTIGGTQYFVPTQRLSQPQNFCCSHGDCLVLGPSYNCIDYSCQTGSGYCVSDIQCQPMGGEMYDANCYHDANDGKFYEWSGGCNLNTNTCEDPIITEVACCPGYCSQWGQWCDKENGCQDPVIPKPDCPPGYCCDGVNHKEQACSGELKCCPTADTHMGICQEECDNCAELNQPCGGTTVCCDDLECTGGFLGIGMTCQEPQFDWSWMWIIILAVLFGLVGYAARGAVTGLLGAVVGGVIGFLIYWFSNLAWWQQLLLGIGGIAGGGILIYLLVIGGGAFLIALIVAMRK